MRYPELLEARNKCDKLEKLVESIGVIAEDNLCDWWGPLVEQPIEGITPATLAIHAREGAARAGAAYNLSQQIKSTLTTSEIIVIKLLVSIYNAYKRNIFKVKSLCNHLCAEHYIIFTLAESRKCFFEGMLG